MIEQYLRRLRIDTTTTELDLIDLIYKKYKIFVSIYPLSDGFSYGIADENLPMDSKWVDQELRSFPSYLIALKQGLCEALAYIVTAVDKGIIITIDGYPASGKSSTAKRIAKEFGYTYIDSGAMYRAAALYYDRTKEPINEETVKNIQISFIRDIDQNQTVYLNNEDVTKIIREPRISALASDIGLVDCVRKYLGNLQKEMGRGKGVVMDGRDIGTVVFPEAELKFFFKADRDVRSQRRLKEYGDMAGSIKLEDIVEDLKLRDWNDVDQFNGERQPKDSIVIDTTLMTEDDQFQMLKNIIEKRLLKKH